MEAGSVSDDEFVGSGIGAAAAVERIAADWLSRDDPLVMPGEIVWLNNTPRGTEVGEAALAREQE